MMTNVTELKQQMSEARCFDHISLLWVAVFIAWLAVGAMFFVGTMHSRDADEVIKSELQQLREAVKECTGARS